MTIARGILVVLSAIVVAIGVGALVGPVSSQSKEPSHHERLLSKLPAAPKLPTYKPDSSWPKLPPPPQPVVESTELESSGTAYVGTYVPEPSSGASSSGGRQHGITGGPQCGC